MNVLIVSFVALIINLPLGVWRRRYKKYTLRWWLVIHTSIPFIVALRIWLDTSYAFIPLFIAAAVLGQFLGGKLSKGKS